MNEFKIGDKIKDTLGYGDVEIVDIYQSVSNQSKVYLVQTDDSQCFAMPDELVSQNGWQI